MSSELEDLYSELLLDHSKRPRNFRPLPNKTAEAHGHNPLCGDRVTVYVQLEDDKVKDVAFEGRGCAISTASASMMTESVKGKSLAEVRHLFSQFHALVTGTEESRPQGLGKLGAFSGIRAYPSRVKCAVLPWHALYAVVQGEPEPVVSTE